MRTTFATLALLCALAGTARADDPVMPETCVCRDAAGALLGTITVVEGARTTITVDRVGGEVGAHAVGEALDIARMQDHAVGQRVLLRVDGSAVAEGLRTDASGVLTCRFTCPAIAIPLDDAFDMTVSGDCANSFRLFAQTAETVGTVDDCDSGSGCASAGSGVAGLVAGLVGWRRRRRG